MFKVLKESGLPERSNNVHAISGHGKGPQFGPEGSAVSGRSAYSWVGLRIFLWSTLIVLLFSGPLIPGEPLPEIPVHFAVITGSEEVVNTATPEILTREIALLNEYMVDRHGRQLVKFRLHSMALYSEIKDSVCPMVQAANSREPTLAWMESRGQPFLCSDHRVMEPRALNVLIVDWYSAKHGLADATSYGMNAIEGRGFVALDYIYLKNPGDQHIRRHEFGHAFGLLHECLEQDLEACPDGPQGPNRSVMGDITKGLQSTSYFYSSRQSQVVLSGAIRMETHLQEMYPRAGIENGSFEATPNACQFWVSRSRTYYRGSPGRSGKIAAMIQPRDRVYQYLELSMSGIYSFRVHVRSDDYVPVIVRL